MSGCTERQANAPHRAKEIDRNRLSASLPVLEENVLEQQGRSSTRALHDPVGDFGYLEMGPYRMGDPRELTDAVNGLDEVTKVVQGHIRNA